MGARVGRLNHTIRCVVKLLDFLSDASTPHEALILSVLLLSAAHHVLLTCFAADNACIRYFNCAFELGWSCRARSMQGSLIEDTILVTTSNKLVTRRLRSRVFQSSSCSGPIQVQILS